MGLQGEATFSKKNQVETKRREARNLWKKEQELPRERGYHQDPCPPLSVSALPLFMHLPVPIQPNTAQPRAYMTTPTSPLGFTI